MAEAHRWPIRLDHCFMRVCLDAVYGRPWPEAVARPALRHADLARAVAVAEAIVAAPDTLPALNEASLRLRGKQRGLAEDGLAATPVGRGLPAPADIGHDLPVPRRGVRRANDAKGTRLRLRR